MRYWLVMPCAGQGRRFGGPLPKQYVQLHGRSIVEWSLATFRSDARCAGAVVALAPGDLQWAEIARQALQDVLTTDGGATRSASVRQALRALAGRAGPQDWVLVHDAARPCLTRTELDALLAAGERHGSGALLAVPVADTVKYAAAASDTRPTVERTVERAGLWRAVTPQMFRYGALCAALDAAQAAGRVPTDESQALEWAGVSPALVAGSGANIKVTSLEDVEIAGALIAARGGRAMMRVGSGVDVHAFGPGEAVMLGGVRIAHSHGVVAHSDGDVILHALCDALLGAAGLGDIGQHFRDDDPRWRGADSREFVRAVLAQVRQRGFSVVNADITVLAEAPRLSPHREAIRQSVAQLLGLPHDRVNIKATTTEKLGYLGRREGLCAQAVVLLAAGASQLDSST